MNQVMAKLRWYNQKVMLGMVLFTTAFCSCDMINPEEGVPAFVAIDTFLLSTNTYSEGPNNHNITDVWMSVNGDFIGVFELPVEMPVLQTGEANIFITAGIKNNGISASREKYPFYTSVQIDTVLHEGETLSLTPRVSYKPETIIDWFENFEDPGVTFDTTSLSDVAIHDTLIDGSKVGAVILQGDLEDFQAVSFDAFAFPEPSIAFFLEMDYKCDHEFEVGLVISEDGILSTEPVMLINPIDHWNKIYIDLRLMASSYNTASSYAVYFAASKWESVERAEILLDNIKILHF